MSELDTALAECRELLAGGDASAAMSRLGPLLDYPGELITGKAEFLAVLELFEMLAGVMGPPKLVECVVASRDEPENVQLLHDLGYQLIEVGLLGFAATTLARANRLEPGRADVVTELVYALETDQRCGEARKVLEAHPALLEESYLCRYLLAFQCVMLADLDPARQLLPDLLASEPEECRGMASRIEGMLTRADTLTGVSTLDRTDLRGWQFVLDGSVLTHLSPFGFDAGMCGRYAFVQDSPGRCLFGLRRLKRVLEVAGQSPERVLLLPDRSSQVMGHAAARLLDVPAEPYALGEAEKPGLLVAYDLGRVENVPVLKSIRRQAPGQVLFTHCLEWTRDFPYTGDVVTFFHQINNPPWESQLRVNTAGDGTEKSEPDARTPEEIAEDVLAAGEEADACEAEEIEGGPSDELAVLERFVEVIGHIPAPHGPGWVRGDGLRRKFFVGGPVGSNRFR